MSTLTYVGMTEAEARAVAEHLRACQTSTWTMNAQGQVKCGACGKVLHEQGRES